MDSGQTTRNNRTGNKYQQNDSENLRIPSINNKRNHDIGYVPLNTIKMSENAKNNDTWGVVNLPNNPGPMTNMKGYRNRSHNKKSSLDILMGSDKKTHKRNMIASANMKPNTSNYTYNNCNNVQKKKQFQTEVPSQNTQSPKPTSKFHTKQRSQSPQKDQNIVNFKLNIGTIHKINIINNNNYNN